MRCHHPACVKLLATVLDTVQLHICGGALPVALPYHINPNAPALSTPLTMPGTCVGVLLNPNCQASTQT
jgi:hypothetical protein